MATRNNSAEEFALALGVEVVEVDDLDGRCAIYSQTNHTMRVCSRICRRQREEAFEALLEDL